MSAPQSQTPPARQKSLDVADCGGSRSGLGSLKLESRIHQLERDLQSFRYHRENKIISSARVRKSRSRKSVGQIPLAHTLGAVHHGTSPSRDLPGAPVPNQAVEYMASPGSRDNSTFMATQEWMSDGSAVERCWKDPFVIKVSEQEMPDEVVGDPGGGELDVVNNQEVNRDETALRDEDSSVSKRRGTI
ncbi:hypothetical protein OQA88_13462 [Cercophora sp. LCS_1]